MPVDAGASVVTVVDVFVSYYVVVGSVCARAADAAVVFVVDAVGYVVAKNAAFR